MNETKPKFDLTQLWFCFSLQNFRKRVWIWICCQTKFLAIVLILWVFLCNFSYDWFLTSIVWKKSFRYRLAYVFKCSRTKFEVIILNDFYAFFLLFWTDPIHTKCIKDKGMGCSNSSLWNCSYRLVVLNNYEIQVACFGLAHTKFKPEAEHCACSVGSELSCSKRQLNCLIRVLAGTKSQAQKHKIRLIFIFWKRFIYSTDFLFVRIIFFVCRYCL